MKMKLLGVALFLVSAALVGSAQAGGGNHGGNGGGGNFASSGRGSARTGGGPSFQSMPARSFGGNRMIYSGQHFSSIGSRAPRSMELRPQYVRSNAVGSNQIVRGNITRGNRSTQFSNRGNRAITNARHDGNGARQVRSGNNIPTNWRNH